MGKNAAPSEKGVYPILRAIQFLLYLKNHPEATYQDLGEMHGIAGARVCQIISLVTKLPQQIVQILASSTDPKVHIYFSERRLRPLAQLATDADKVRKFKEMRDALERE